MYVLLCQSPEGNQRKEYDPVKTNHYRAIRSAKRFAIRWLEKRPTGSVTMYGHDINERYTIKDLEDLKDQL